MRKTGHYATERVPSYDRLVAATTPSRRQTLTPLSATIVPACEAYDEASPNVHARVPIGLAKAAKDALIDAFENRTVAMNRLLAEMTNSLPRRHADLCPYCTLDTNPDLDHYLPKEEFPEFALHGRNLVYICTTCNRKKSKYFKSVPDENRLFIHPAYEPTSLNSVITVTLRYAPRAVVAKYSIDDNADVPDDEKAQLTRHFTRLGLQERYATRAQNSLTALKEDLAGHNEETIRRTLDHKIQSSLVGEPINGWSKALYRAVAMDQNAMSDWLLGP